MKINQQKSSDKMWADETGTEIPYSRTTKYERQAERSLASMAKEAVKINEGLAAFKERIRQESMELYELFCQENGGKPGKGRGGATFYNFDRSIKMEVSIHDLISFDENTIELAKQKLDELLNDGLTGAKDFVKPLVMEAFNTSGGRLDTKKVLGLKRHAAKVRQPLYDEAMALIDKAIRRPQTREYYRVWVRDERGEYQDIQLNFSAI